MLAALKTLRMMKSIGPFSRFRFLPGCPKRFIQTRHDRAGLSEEEREKKDGDTFPLKFISSKVEE